MSGEDHASVLQERDALRTQVERLLVQLAGCGVAALQNTRDTAQERIDPGSYGWSASYRDVCAAVDREMDHREACEALQAKLRLHAGDVMSLTNEIRDLEGLRDEQLTEMSALTSKNDALTALLKEWLRFASDVQPADAAGYDWLNGLKGRTATATAEPVP